MGKKETRTIQQMDEDIYHIPIDRIDASVGCGWWSVVVGFVDNEGKVHCFQGKKDRSFFKALQKAIRVAYENMV